MKNGYTPKQFAYAIAMTYIDAVYRGTLYDLEDDNTDLTASEKEQVRVQLKKLHDKLAKTSKLDAYLGESK
jgi:hypothetical protein